MNNIDRTIILTGVSSDRSVMTRRRLGVMIALIAVGFGTVGIRLVQLGATETVTMIEGQEISAIEASRPAILDRNGLEMAVDLRVPSLFAEPRRIINVEEVVGGLRAYYPNLMRVGCGTALPATGDLFGSNAN